MIYDIAVIGGGPGGYTAAEEAAKAGLSVILFEKDKLGGTCLNRGCIPTKALLKSAETFAEVRSASTFGITAEAPKADFNAIHARKTQVVDTLRGGIEKLMKSLKITVVYEAAQITSLADASSGREAFSIAAGGESYQARQVIAAAGSVPALPPIPGSDLPGVITSNQILEGRGASCKSLIIIGGGVIGVECASIYLPLGVSVTILEMADHLLPPMDKEIAQRLNMMLKKKGAKIEVKAAVTGIRTDDGSLTVTWTDKKGNPQETSGEMVLIATGRRPAADGLFASDYVKPEMNRGGIVGDYAGRTNIPGLFVIGDAKAANIQLAHVAEAQARNAVSVIKGGEASIDISLIPSCVYTDPEIASVGLTEEKAKAEGIEVICGKALTGANGKCLIGAAESGYVKLVAAKEDGRLLGAQMVCPRATDMIGELTLAIQKKLTATELIQVVHPHPTISEMITAAAREMK